MKAESNQRPQSYHMDVCGDDVVIRFAANITEQQVDSIGDGNELETVYRYDAYLLTIKNRAGLEEAIAANPEQWLEKAKQSEINALSAEIRAQRDALLADTDKDFALDRIQLTIPDKVTASTMLNAVVDIFGELKAVCSSEMARYRQALRDVPQQEGFPYDVKFPIKPNP